MLPEVVTGLSHKTTILLSPALHRRLTQLAEERGQSLGEPIRQACERQYGLADRGGRLAAVEALAAMRLPVGPVEEMVAESVPAPRDRRLVEVGLLEHERHAEHPLPEVDRGLAIGADQGDVMNALGLQLCTARSSCHTNLVKTYKSLPIFEDK